jgi:uncharacterized repeat protein (TIGR01451 family)
MNLRSILLIGLAAFAGGCATPNLERIATVQSRAEALYAYGGVATFPVSSELVEVSVYAPVHHQREYQPIPIEREKTKPVINAQPANPAVGEQPAKPAASEPPIKPNVTEPTHSADADTQEQAASTKAQGSAAQTKEKPLESAEPTEVQKETVATSEQTATQIEKPQAADVRQQTVAADTRVSERQPTFHKKVSKDHVTVGEKFEFTMEFQNSTPVDLASVQLNDPVDTRLKIFSDQIQVKPNFKHHVSVGNGEVVVRFTKELKRGKRVRVTVPVMFPVTSAAAAQ